MPRINEIQKNRNDIKDRRRNSIIASKGQTARSTVDQGGVKNRAQVLEERW